MLWQVGEEAEYWLGDGDHRHGRGIRDVGQDNLALSFRTLY